MRTFTLDEIRTAIDLDHAFGAIREGFIALSLGRVDLGAVGHLAFPQVRGECHIKSAAMIDADVFVVKIATGFSNNTNHGLPTSNGMMALFSARTGQPLALLQDEGWLTDVRTAIAGAIATKAIMPTGATTVGVVGTGIQAKLQAKLAAGHTGMQRVVLWGRRSEQAERVASDLAAEVVEAYVLDTLEELAAIADVIITTTPANTPLLTQRMFAKPARIVAVGADAPGKQEVASDLTASMDVLIADSIEQCLDHGELARPYREGLVDAARVRKLGDILARPSLFSPSQGVLVDLTGVGIQDLQIANSFWTRWASRRGDVVHAAGRP